MGDERHEFVTGGKAERELMEIAVSIANRRLAERTAELAAARATIARYEDGVCWGTTCLSCTNVLNNSIIEYERAERAEQALTEARVELAALRAQHPSEGAVSDA